MEKFIAHFKESIEKIEYLLLKKRHQHPATYNQFISALGKKCNDVNAFKQLEANIVKQKERTDGGFDFKIFDDRLLGGIKEQTPEVKLFRLYLWFQFNTDFMREFVSFRLTNNDLLDNNDIYRSLLNDEDLLNNGNVSLHNNLLRNENSK